MQKLIFFDLDGTLINNPSSEKSYLFWLITRGHVGIRQVGHVLKFFGKWMSTFKFAVFIKNKAYLCGLPVQETIRQAEQFTIRKLLPRLRPHIIQRLKQHQTNGDIVILLTGAPKFIADVFAKQLKIFNVRATEFSCCDNCFDDLPPLQHPFAQEKVSIAQQVCAEYKSDIRDSVAYANSIHDLELLKSVGQAVVVTPDRKLRCVAMQKKWEMLE